MSVGVFINTSGLYAWVNKNDPWHQAMCSLPAAEGCRLVLSDYIVDEALFTLCCTKNPSSAPPALSFA